MTELLASAIRLTVPVGYVALGETVSERSGVLNIGLEGAMYIGAFVGAWVAAVTGSVLLGFLGAAGGGVVTFALVAVAYLALRADQIVIGIGLNLIGIGGTTVAIAAIPDAGRAPGLSPVHPPVLADIPVVGPVLFQQNPAFYLLLLVAALVALAMSRTAWGLRVQAAGEAPVATDSAGVGVNRIRLEALLVCGALVGLGGAALAIGDLRGFTINMVAGRGFIALAAVIFGRWRPWWVLAASGVFGLADALRFQLPGWGVNLPASLPIMLPYVVALLALATLRGRNLAPAALGVPFVREEG